jgi:hypothetical protein
MRSGDDRGDPLLAHDCESRAGFIEISRAIIDAGHQMRMKIKHLEQQFNWAAQSPMANY